MEGIQVNISELLSISDTLLDSLFGLFIGHHRSGDLASVKDLGAVNSRLGDCFCTFGFVGVVFCAVDLCFVSGGFVEIVIDLHVCTRLREL